MGPETDSGGALLAILDSAPAGVVLLDEACAVLYANARVPEILGVEHAGLAAAVAQLMGGALLARGLDDHEMAVEFTRPDGAVRALRLSVDGVGFGVGESTIVWVYDVTEMRNAYVEAERAARHQSAFLATMSHEIRTPMNGISTIADLLAETPLDADQRRMVGTIRTSSEALLAIIDAVLDVSKIEAGRLEIEEAPFAPAAVARGVADLLRPRAEEKGLHLFVRVAEAVPPWVAGDGNRVRQILINLIGNAVKFTDRGFLRLGVSAAPAGGLRFEVEDSGIGITGEQRLRLFSPFVQADASIARRFGGSGLGLSICRGLVELMGGAIGVESQPGEGSLFWFEVPLPACDAPQAEAGAGAPVAGPWAVPDRGDAEAAGAVVLCAEDNATNRYVLERVLTRLGIVFDMAADGVEALERLRFGVHGLVLSDLHMPRLDGYALTRAIRSAEAEAGRAERLPILALSADGVRGAVERSLAAGMDGHLVKPIRLEELNAALLRHLPAAGRLRTPLADPSSKEPPPVVAALDLSLLRDLIGDDPDALRDALEDFRRTAAALVQVIERDTDSLEERGTAAHSLKSSARCVGAHDLSRHAEAFEEAALAGDEARAGAQVAAIRGAFRRWAALALGANLR